MNTRELFSNISKDIMLEFDKTKKIGHLRCQFGYDRQIANQFIPFESMDKKSKRMSN